MSTTDKRKAKIAAAKAAKLHVLIKDDLELAIALNDAARATIALNALTQELNAELQVVKERYADKLDAMASIKEEREDAIQSYCERHRAQVFPEDKQSVTIAGHTLKFHKGTGKLTTIKGVTEATVIDRLIEHEDEALSDKCLNWKPSLDKDAIKAAFPDHRETFTEMGLAIQKDESFTIELDLKAGADIAKTAQVSA
jgi:phage host-nuclease inhibitor protein Gam